MRKYNFLLIIVFAVFVMLPFNVNAMEIFIQPPEGKNISLEVESSDTIEDVKGKIFRENSTFLISEQRLYFNNREMTDGRTLGDYAGLTAGSIVKLEIVEDTPVNVILNANGGMFTDNKEVYIIEDFYGTSEGAFPTREGYVFKGYYTEKDGGLIINYYLPDNIIKKEMTFYAHWDVIGTTTIDFTKIINDSNFTELEIALLNVLFNNGTLVVDQTDSSLTNKSGKTLVKVDDAGYITVAEGLTLSDNFVYTLSDEEKNQILDENTEINYVPDKLELIFAKEEVYKVILDANEGTFENGTTYTIDNWDISLYDSLVNPTRDGYKFLGYFTEKTGGTKFEMILNESGIDSDMTFYAQWEKINKTPSGNESLQPEEENPKTFDGIGNSIFIGTISLIGLVGATIYLKKKNKVRA